MADVFISAVSIIFIILLVSDPTISTPDRKPQADFSVTCKHDQYSITTLDATAENVQSVTFTTTTDLKNWLQSYKPSFSLSAKILVKAMPDDIDCSATVVKIIRKMNDDLSKQTKTRSSGTYYLYQQQLIMPTEAWNSNPDKPAT